MEKGAHPHKNLKANNIKMMLCYYFSSEKLKGEPKKVELVKDVTDLFRKDWEGLVYREGGWRSLVTNEAGAEMGEICIILV